jgi:hypothetical protein
MNFSRCRTPAETAIAAGIDGPPPLTVHRKQAFDLPLRTDHSMRTSRLATRKTTVAGSGTAGVLGQQKASILSLFLDAGPRRRRR